jgi:hypothetical protein
MLRSFAQAAGSSKRGAGKVSATTVARPDRGAGEVRRRLDQLRHRLKQPVAGVANSAASQATVRQYEIWWASLPLPVGRRRVLLLSRNPAYAYLIKVLVAEVAYDPGESRRR